MQYNLINYNKVKTQKVTFGGSTYILPKNTRSVVKITAGDKYIITKCGSIEWLCKEISTLLGKYQRRNVGIDETNFYTPLIQYIYKYQIPEINIEVLYTSTNGYNVLKYELDELMKHFGKKGCLNNNTTPYLPALKQKDGTDQPSSRWLTLTQFANFNKLLIKKGFRTQPK